MIKVVGAVLRMKGPRFDFSSRHLLIGGVNIVLIERVEKCATDYRFKSPPAPFFVKSKEIALNPLIVVSLAGFED